MTSENERETATIRKGGGVCADDEKGPWPSVESERLLVLVDNCFQTCHTTSGSHRHEIITLAIFSLTSAYNRDLFPTNCLASCIYHTFQPTSSLVLH